MRNVVTIPGLAPRSANDAARLPPIKLNTDPAQRDSDEIIANTWALKAFSKRLTELTGVEFVQAVLSDIAKTLVEIVPDDPYRG